MYLSTRPSSVTTFSDATATALANGFPPNVLTGIKHKTDQERGGGGSKKLAYLKVAKMLYTGKEKLGHCTDINA